MEAAFASVLAESGSRPPVLRDVCAEYRDEDLTYEFRATFSAGEDRRWRIPDRELDGLRPTWRDREARSLYARMADNHRSHMRRSELGRVRDQRPWEVDPSTEVAFSARNQRRTLGVVPLATYQTLPEWAVIEALPVPDFSVVSSMIRDMRRIMEDTLLTGGNWATSNASPQDRPPVLTVAMINETMQRIEGCTCPMCGRATFPYSVEAAAKRQEAEARSLALFKSWLSPEQLVQFEREDRIEVKGSDTGRTYRIERGRTSNIFEIMPDGRMANWCFVPDGNLATGDVMLAQKIALETMERKAMKVANRVPQYVEMYQESIRAAPRRSSPGYPWE